MPSPTYYVAQRSTSDIVLYLSPNHVAPPLPFEMQGTITQDAWAERVPIIAKTAARYSKPIFERVWTIFGLIVTVVLPMTLHRVIINALMGASRQKEIAVLYEARAITAAMTVALVCFFIVPLMIWKLIGRARVRQLLSTWAMSDERNASSTGNVSKWRVKTPGLFNNHIVLTISLPVLSTPSSFHPNAYLPSYINKANDAGADYFYPYKPGSGLPRMSVVGKFPNSSGMKREFEDTKV